MSLLAAALFTFVANTCVAPDGAYVWEVEYADGVTDTYQTTWRIDFEPRPFRDFRIRHSFNGGPMGEWSKWYDAVQFPGDATGDCVVGTPDLLAVQQHWGQSCP